MYFNRKCKITFISHGATIYSEEGRFSDAQNYPPLSELGVEEVQNIVKYLRMRGVKNNAIYTSPSVRTVQTALLISKMYKQDYEIIDDLTPRLMGEWNGLTYSDIMQKYPQGLNNMFNITDKPAQKGGESSIDFIARIKVVIDKLVEKNEGNRIIIVTHPEVIQASICAALGINAVQMSKIYIRTGSLTQISYFENWSSLVYSDHVPL